MSAAPEDSTPDFTRHLREAGCGPLTRAAPTTLQLNIGKRCNLACHHCHVESGPKRTEAMDRRGAERVIELLARNPRLATLDLTGGAPELNPHFRFLVEEARKLGRHVIDRCNLTVLFELGQEDTAEFLAEQRVEIVASLPCYTAENVDQQRGRGVFKGSIEALQWLNRLGYANPENDDAPELNLVYNPLGASLPPPQADLEKQYRHELHGLFGIRFDQLFTITNMPIKRFAHDLLRDGQSEAYTTLLANHFNPETIPALMCRSLISVDHDGRLYDCDFNQALEIPIAGPEQTIWDLDDVSLLADRPIATASHCFGCTAGSGSSCGGTLADDEPDDGI